MSIKFPVAVFDQLPIDIFEMMAENIKLKKWDTKSIEDLILSVGFKELDDGSMILPIKTSHVMVGSIEEILKAISKDTIDLAEQLLNDEGISTKNLDELRILAKASRVMSEPYAKHTILNMDSWNSVLFVDKKHYNQGDGYYAIPVDITKKQKKTMKKDKVSDVAVKKALEELKEPTDATVSGSVKTRALKLKEVDEVTLRHPKAKSKKNKKENKRPKKMSKEKRKEMFDNLNKLQKSALIDLIINK